MHVSVGMSTIKAKGRICFDTSRHGLEIKRVVDCTLDGPHLSHLILPEFLFHS